MDVLVLALALLLVAGLAFAAGAGAGAWRAFRLVDQRRALARANTGFARLWPETLPTRSAADLISGRVRVQLGGVVYDLPVLPRNANREWLASLDESFRHLGDALEAASDDTGQILQLLLAQTDGLFEMLRSYDQTGVLPDSGEIEETATDVEILRAVLEVWRAANPLAATLVEATDGSTSGTSSGQPSSSPSRSAGARTTSASA